MEGIASTNRENGQEQPLMACPGRDFVNYSNARQFQAVVGRLSLFRQVSDRQGHEIGPLNFENVGYAPPLKNASNKFSQTFHAFNEFHNEIVQNKSIHVGKSWKVIYHGWSLRWHKPLFRSRPLTFSAGSWYDPVHKPLYLVFAASSTSAGAQLFGLVRRSIVHNEWLLCVNWTPSVLASKASTIVASL